MLPVYTQLISAFLGGMIIFVVSSFVLRKINKAIILEINDLILLVRVIVLAGTLFAMLLTWVQSKKQTYTLTEDSIILGKGGLMKSRKMYMFKNVNSLAVRQSMLGLRYGYGDVIINMDRLENSVEVRLRSVENPQQVADEIHSHMSAK